MSEPEDPQRRIMDELEEYRRLQAEAEAEGIPALRRLVAVAQGNSGQAQHIRAFLLGLYNSYSHPFELNRLRPLDRDLQADVLAVLRMDMSPRQEVHCYVEGGLELFEGWRRELAETSDSG